MNGQTSEAHGINLGVAQYFHLSPAFYLLLLTLCILRPLVNIINTSKTQDNQGLAVDLTFELNSVVRKTLACHTSNPKLVSSQNLYSHHLFSMVNIRNLSESLDIQRLLDFISIASGSI